MRLVLVRQGVNRVLITNTLLLNLSLILLLTFRAAQYFSHTVHRSSQFRNETRVGRGGGIEIHVSASSARCFPVIKLRGTKARTPELFIPGIIPAERFPAGDELGPLRCNFHPWIPRRVCAAKRETRVVATEIVCHGAELHPRRTSNALRRTIFLRHRGFQKLADRSSLSEAEFRDKQSKSIFDEEIK